MEEMRRRKRNRRGRVRKEESQRQEERGIAEAGGQVWMVLAWPRPPSERRITTACCDEAAPPLGQVWMVLAWPRPPTGEENHDGMLR